MKQDSDAGVHIKAAWSTCGSVMGLDIGFGKTGQIKGSTRNFTKISACVIDNNSWVSLIQGETRFSR